MRVLILCLGVFGCSNLVLGTAVELQRLSPMDANPMQIAVAIDLPDGFGIYPDSAVLRLSVEQSLLGMGRAEQFTLERSGVELAILRIARDDYARLKDIQMLAKSWEQADADATKGSLSVDLTPCLRSELADFSETFSVSIRLAEDAPFQPLLRGIPVSAIVKTQDLNQLPKCPLPR